EQKLKEKIENLGKPLKDWDVKIYRGVLTGLNEAFIIDDIKRQEILDNCKDEDERIRTEAIIKPILRGRDIKRYYYKWAGLWVIVIPAGWTNEKRKNEAPEFFIECQFPSLIKYLKNFETKAKKRDDQGDYWWELRACAYYPEFEKEKVVYPNMANRLVACLDKSKFYVNQKCFIITGNNMRYICGLLNSNIEFWFFKKIGATLGREGFEMSKIFIEKLPVPPITTSNQHMVSQIESLVDKILAAKKTNHAADTTTWEKEINQLVYQLYELTDEEIAIVENGSI
ncbi:MAG: TaqI-like C-terminal specificity domain-containing protein, partial [Bacteroidales bacterium]